MYIIDIENKHSLWVAFLVAYIYFDIDDSNYMIFMVSGQHEKS